MNLREWEEHTFMLTYLCLGIQNSSRNINSGWTSARAKPFCQSASVREWSHRLQYFCRDGVNDLIWFCLGQGGTLITSQSQEHLACKWCFRCSHSTTHQAWKAYKSLGFGNSLASSHLVRISNLRKLHQSLWRRGDLWVLWFEDRLLLCLVGSLYHRLEHPGYCGRSFLGGRCFFF